MGELFRTKVIVEQLNISESRSFELDEGLDLLHRALCKMDLDNLERVKNAGDIM